MALVKINFLALIVKGALDQSGCLVSSSDLEHRVRMVLLSLAFLTEIEVIADTTLVSNTSDWTSVAGIASYVSMDLCLLVSSLFA